MSAEVGMSPVSTQDLAPWTVYFKDTNKANLHIIAPEGVFRRRPARPWSLCGLHPYQTDKGARLVVVTDLQRPLRPGCHWCPKCVGMALVAFGQATELARMVISFLERVDQP